MLYSRGCYFQGGVIQHLWYTYTACGWVLPPVIAVPCSLTLLAVPANVLLGAKNGTEVGSALCYDVDLRPRKRYFALAR